jgi:hypothetical protein
MKNKQHQFPSNLVRIWTPSTHSLFPLKFRQVVKSVLMLGAKRQDGTPYYPQTHFHKLPKDLLFLILHYVVLPTTGQPKPKEREESSAEQKHESTHNKKRKRSEP